MRRTLAAVLLLGLVLAPATALAQQAQPEIRDVDTSRFPAVAVTLSLPGQASLAADDVEVTENGEDIDVASVEPIGESTVGVDVVLVVDTSGSMKGQPIAAAKAAAKEFVQGIPDAARVGVVTFSGAAAVALPLTGDHGKAGSILSGLGTHGSTALYDAIVDAAGLFSGNAQRTIVLLSDGRDETSAATLDAAIDAATGAEASVFAIGLESEDFDPDVLSAIAAQTDGRFLKAGAADLGEAYKSLAVQISRQFVVRYTSSAAAGRQLDIEVDAAGTTLTKLALAPEPEPTKGASQPPTEEVTPLIRGTWGFALIVVLSFGALFLLLWMLIGTTARVRAERTRAARMSAVARPMQQGQEAVGGEQHSTWIPQTMLQVAGRVVEAGGFGATLDHQLEQAGLPMRAGEFVAASVLGVVAGAFVGLVVFQNVVFVLLLAVAGGLVPYGMLSFALGRRTKRMDEQLPDVLTILASSLRAGYSFLQALDTVAKEIPEPGASEFNRTVAEIRLGRPVDEALGAMAERVGSEDFHWAVLAVNIQREVGGNLAEILDTVSDTIRERQAIRREVRVLTTEGRLSAYVLIALPILFGLYLFSVKRDYLSLLVTTRPGLIMLGTAISLLVLGYFWIRKIVNIDV